MSSNSWYQFVEAEAVFHEGDEDNMPNDPFTRILIKDMPLLPLVVLYSRFLIRRKCFEYLSRKYFNILIHCVYKNVRSSKLRVDETVDIPCRHFIWRMKQAKAARDRIQRNDHNDTPMTHHEGTGHESGEMSYETSNIDAVPSSSYSPHSSKDADEDGNSDGGKSR